MTKPIDGQKREEWRTRLKQYEASGLTIAQFCRNEGMAPHTFYYWNRRLRRKPNGVRRSRLARRARKQSRGRDAAAGRRASAVVAPVEKISTAAEGVPSDEPMIHFTWDSKLCFSIPANCLDAIRCVLEYTVRDNDKSTDANSLANGFRQLTIA